LLVHSTGLLELHGFKPLRMAQVALGSDQI